MRAATARRRPDCCPASTDVLTWASALGARRPAARCARTTSTGSWPGCADWRFAEAVVLTSFHQSPLPTALLLRLAGVAPDHGRLGRLPGRPARRPPAPRRGPPRGHPRARAHARPSRPPRATRPSTTAASPSARRRPSTDLVPDGRYVVVHPGAAGARPALARRARRAGPSRCWPTPGGASSSPAAPTSGASPPRSPGARASTSAAAPTSRSCPGCWPGPRRSSSATPARRTWPPRSAPRSSRCSPRSSRPCAGRPYGVPHVLLGDQQAPLPRTRAPASARCPATPASRSVTPEAVVEAVAALAARAVAEVPA